MHLLLDIAAALVLAVLLGGLVALALRRSMPAEPYRRTAKRRSRLRERAAGWVLAVAVLLSFGAAVAVQTAFGPPAGERGPVTVRVLDSGDCDRPVRGFGLVVSCDLAGWSSPVPSESYLGDAARPQTVGGGTVAAGDLVAEYTVTDWRRLLMGAVPQEQWRAVEDESKPDLTWLAAAIPLAVAVLGGAVLAVRRGRGVSGVGSPS